MTEQEYIRATNLAKLRAAEAILSTVLPADDASEHGISRKEWVALMRPLHKSINRLTRIDMVNEE